MDNTVDYEQTATWTATFVNATDFKNYTCSATNELGTIEALIEVKKASPPAKPTGLIVTTSFTSVELSWEAPESVGIPITSYTIVYTDVKTKTEMMDNVDNGGIYTLALPV